MKPDDVQAHQSALEALRSGVPNSDAVRVLGCNQSRAQEKFTALLGEMTGRESIGGPSSGMLVAGDFGTGKSHLLTFFEQQALEAGFVVSRVVVSKETPLSDPSKVFRAMVREARIPRITGPVIAELALMLRTDKEATREFDLWATHAAPGLLGATFLVHDRSNDQEVLNRMVAFWSGEPVAVSDVKRALKQVGVDRMSFDIKPIPTRELALARIEFASRLARGAGFKGWVILLDELELVGRYSPTMRAQSYAELARWMGIVAGLGVPGVISVGAITEDFGISVLQVRGDAKLLGQKVRENGDAMLADHAELGMEFIRRDAITLTGPTAESLASCYGQIRDVHARAYDWTPPEIEHGDITIRSVMRTFVRSWINDWDLLREHPGVNLDPELDVVRPGYPVDDALTQAGDGPIDGDA